MKITNSICQTPRKFQVGKLEITKHEELENLKIWEFENLKIS